MPTMTKGKNATAAFDAVRPRNSSVMVLVGRVGVEWRAEVAASGAVCRARSLMGLHRQVQKLLGKDVADYVFRTGDVELDRLVWQVRAVRTTTRALQARTRLLTGRVLALSGGCSGRDLAVLLGMSHQRVQQLVAQHGRVGCERG